jgi:O-antigen/teichoic acid export membrane protein
LRILGLALVFMMVNIWQGFTLLSAGRQRVTLGYDTAGLVLNLGINVVLIAWLGYVGPAIAALVTSVFIVCCATIAVKRVLGVNIGIGPMRGVVLASAALGVGLGLLLQLGTPWPLAAVIASLSYPCWLLVFRVTTWAEIRSIIAARPAATAGPGDGLTPGRSAALEVS